MTESTIQTEVERLIASCEGELTTHSRVIDGLLDLRTVCTSSQLVAVLDNALATVPGRNVVETDWWRNQLRSFQVLAELADVTDAHFESVSEPIWAAL